VQKVENHCFTVGSAPTGRHGTGPRADSEIKIIGVPSLLWTSKDSRNAQIYEHFNFVFQPHYGPGVDSASNRNEYQESSWGYRAAGAWG
jgi:hypothetical protein